MNSANDPKALNNFFQNFNKEDIPYSEHINKHNYKNQNKNHKNNFNHSYNKVLKVNRTYIRDSDEFHNHNKSNEHSININDNSNKEYSSSYMDSYGTKYKLNKNNYNSNNISFNKYNKLKEGKIQLFEKRCHQSSLKTNHTINSRNKEKIKSLQRNKEKCINNDYYSTNKMINHFLLNNTNNNKSVKNGQNHHKPIRLNYNVDIEKEIIDKENYSNNSNKYKNYLQQKINEMKKKICFKGNNDQFIEYLKIIKIKSDIANIITNMFSDTEKLNEGDIKNYFYKLELLKNNKKENENLLNIYKYLAEQLLMANNINKCDISTEI